MLCVKWSGTIYEVYVLLDQQVSVTENDYSTQATHLYLKVTLCNYTAVHEGERPLGCARLRMHPSTASQCSYEKQEETMQMRKVALRMASALE